MRMRTFICRNKQRKEIQRKLLNYRIRRPQCQCGAVARSSPGPTQTAQRFGTSLPTAARHIQTSLVLYSYCARDLFLRLRQITFEGQHVTSQTQEQIYRHAYSSRLLPPHDPHFAQINRHSARETDVVVELKQIHAMGKEKKERKKIET